MQRGVLKFEPKLLPSYDFLYGPNATGSCYFYGAGGLRPLGSCRMTDGVAQGDGFGPLFFSLGLDELLTAVRPGGHERPHGGHHHRVLPLGMGCARGV